MIIKNGAPGLPTRPPTCPAIRHTKVGETSLWMISPKERASSQACFLLHVPTGHRAEKGLQPFHKWEETLEQQGLASVTGLFRLPIPQTEIQRPQVSEGAGPQLRAGRRAEQWGRGEGAQN